MAVNGRSIALYWEFARPFTLVPPLLGMIAGGLWAYGATRLVEPLDLRTVFVNIVAGGVAAALINGFSNGLNQLMDVDIDRINKPGRPIPSGRLTRREALTISVILAVAGLTIAWFIQPRGKPDFLVVAAMGMACTILYSGPILRAKAIPGVANLMIAIPRGCLLVVAGWSCVARPWANPEPWIVGLVIGLFVFGATSTKDFSDMEGDRTGGCRTLPVVLGPRRAVLVTLPFLVLPWCLLAILSLRQPPVLSGNSLALAAVGVGLALYGTFVGWTLLRDTVELTQHGNHPSWTHMYLMMLVAQMGITVGYLLG